MSKQQRQLFTELQPVADSLMDDGVTDNETKLGDLLEATIEKNIWPRYKQKLKTGHPWLYGARTVLIICLGKGGRLSESKCRTETARKEKREQIVSTLKRAQRYITEYDPQNTSDPLIQELISKFQPDKETWLINGEKTEKYQPICIEDSILMHSGAVQKAGTGNNLPQQTQFERRLLTHFDSVFQTIGEEGFNIAEDLINITFEAPQNSGNIKQRYNDWKKNNINPVRARLR